MSDARQTDDHKKSEENDDHGAEQLKRLTLNEENGVSEQNQCTPTLDYLEVPTINGNVDITLCALYSLNKEHIFLYRLLSFCSPLSKNCTGSTKIQ